MQKYSFLFAYLHKYTYFCVIIYVLLYIMGRTQYVTDTKTKH